MSEHREQCIVVEYCELKHLPIFAIPNGIYLADRLTATRIMSKMKQEGLRKGVPDLFLPIPKGGYHGLFIEMKFGKNKTSRDQDWWINILSNYEYQVSVCWSANDAIKKIEEYLKSEDS